MEYEKVWAALETLASLRPKGSELDGVRLKRNHPKLIAEFIDQHPDGKILDLEFVASKAAKILANRKSTTSTSL
jgi:hypothetical protein